MTDASLAPTRRKLDVDAYCRMAEAGIFAPDDRVELIDGEIIDMAPIGQEHAGVVNSLTRALVIACGERAIVSPQNPVRLDPLNEPQPDFAVLRPRSDFYATGERAGPGDVVLLIEVSDSSLRFDREVKLPLYARSGIGELWLVDLKRRVVDAYRRPEGVTYKEQATYRPGDAVALALAPEITVRLELAFA